MKRTILMLEHDDDDRYITQAVLDDLNAEVNINFVTTSTDFFTMLEKTKPDLLIITYRATPLGAVEVLKKLRGLAGYRYTPAVVISGIANDTIVRECYQAGASSFVVKPPSGNETTSKISMFLDYWFKTVELPKNIA